MLRVGHILPSNQAFTPNFRLKFDILVDSKLSFLTRTDKHMNDPKRESELT